MSTDINITAAATADATDSPTTKTFAALGVPSALVAALAADGKEHAFPIQESTLADTLAGRDVLGRGRTGSGKTLAFAIPVVAKVAATGAARPEHPAALILAPTRELATQIAAAVEPLARAVGMTVSTVFGGVNQRRQVDALRRGVDILVACPGRLEDLMGQGHVRLDRVCITVLDEADHMADLGFLPGVTRILAATPPNAQRLLFSATLDNGVDKLVKRFLTDHRTHAVDSASSPVTAMTHHVFSVADQAGKNEVLDALASGSGRRILFTRTKHQAKKLAKKMTASGIPAVDLHGNLSQAQRDRNLAAFSDGGVRVLVATDVAARGVHVDEVELVVHVDPPAEHKAYLHRSGRTARAGSAGDVVTLCLPDQRRDLTSLLRRAGVKATPTPVTATSVEVSDLVGEVAERVTPAPVAATPQQSRPRRGSGNASGSGARRGGRGGQGARSQGGRSQGGRGGAGHGRGGPARRAERHRAN